MISIGGLLLSVVFLLIIPLILGYLWCDRLDIQKNFASLYVFGTFFIWACSQVILVPFVLMDLSFTAASIFLLAVTILFIVISLYRYYHNNPVLANSHFKRFSLSDVSMSHKAGFALLVIVVLFVIIHSITLQYTDADDSRFVVLAMDTIKSDRLLRINPASGRELTNYIGEMRKEFSSPWPVYIAHISNICGIKASIMFHTVLPPFLYLVISCGFWLLSDIFFNGQFGMRCLFVSLVWYIIIFSNYSVFNAESFIIFRIWQGKAVVAGLTIPMLLYGLVRIYRQSSWQNWLSLWIVNLGSCLLSGNGIVIGVLMILSYGLVYAYIKKQGRILGYAGAACIVNFLYYMVNQKADLFL